MGLIFYVNSQFKYQILIIKVLDAINLCFMSSYKDQKYICVN